LLNIWLRSIQGNLTETEITFFRSMMSHELTEAQLMAQGIPFRYLGQA